MDQQRIKAPVNPATRQFLKTAAGAAAAGGLALALPSVQAQGAPRQGAEYRPVDPPQQTETTGKIEVLEFFWYGCPHCNSFEPTLKDWVARQPADVAFRKLHVGLVPSWVAHQQMFFALEAIGKAAELNEAIFRAIHVERNALNKPELMADFVAGKGVDRKLFLDAYKSFGVRTRMSKASQQSKGYGLEGVPALAVNGKWFTAPSMAGGNAQALRVVEFLIERERKLRG
ncbi:MAG: thiol:disulfide interchange protein DsbA/DsbL [Quisquiliibacterium sp.]|jgi:thiol:disulfide interchange protein DsbA